MADYQALPPGLNSQWYHGKQVDPNDFQLKGMGNATSEQAIFDHCHSFSNVICQLCCTYTLVGWLLLCPRIISEPLDNDFFKRDIPSFLPPACFSKCDKPISYT